MDLLTEIVGMKKERVCGCERTVFLQLSTSVKLFHAMLLFGFSGFSYLNNFYISFHSPSCFIVRMVAWYSFQMIHGPSPKFWLSTLALVWP